jgi:hypothetical protein
VSEPVLPPGWSCPKPEHLPSATAWPALFALGVTLFAWGIVSSPPLLLFGGALLVFALGHWIGEMVHDAH